MRAVSSGTGGADWGCRDMGYFLLESIPGEPKMLYSTPRRAGTIAPTTGSLLWEKEAHLLTIRQRYHDSGGGERELERFAGSRRCAVSDSDWLVTWLKSGPRVGDGAMGTMLQRAGLPQGAAPEAWNRERPEA